MWVLYINGQTGTNRYNPYVASLVRTQFFLCGSFSGVSCDPLDKVNRQKIVQICFTRLEVKCFEGKGLGIIFPWHTTGIYKTQYTLYWYYTHNTLATHTHTHFNCGLCVWWMGYAETGLYSKQKTLFLFVDIIYCYALLK